jgi:hypothetical protein
MVNQWVSPLRLSEANGVGANGEHAAMRLYTKTLFEIKATDGMFHGL